MVYVYDIILNWTDTDKVYEFFEWEINDELEHIKKIPLLKISENAFDELLNYNVMVDENILNKICNLTEVYENSKIEKIKYATLFTDGFRIMAFQFDDGGSSIFRSRMLLDEEEEVIFISNKLIEFNFKIQKGTKRKEYKDITRLEYEIQKVLQAEIKNSYQQRNFDKLKYLYFELFSREPDNMDRAYEKLLESINKEINYKHNRIYELVKISYQNKKLEI